MIYLKIDLMKDRAAKVRLTVVKDGQPVDLTLPGTAIFFTAKKFRSDAYADAVIAKTLAAGSITVEGVDHNIAVVAIDDLDTATLNAPTVLAWDCTLDTPDAERVTVAYGNINVRSSVSDPPEP